MIIGLTFAYLTAVLLLNEVARRHATSVNGWSALRDVGQPGNGVLLRAALQRVLPVVNVFEEAAYWTTTTDVSEVRLSGDRVYRMHFGADGLPPSGAFWSLTATGPDGYLVQGMAGRPSVDSHTGLVANADGSVDVLLQHGRPASSGQNWIATPPGRFKLMLRAYLPGKAIIEGTYEVPPVVEVR